MLIDPKNIFEGTGAIKERTSGVGIISCHPLSCNLSGAEITQADSGVELVPSSAEQMFHISPRIQNY